MTAAPSPGDAARPLGLRIGDAERNAAVEALQQHLASGRLTLDEFSDRSAKVVAARTQDDVAEVFADLPPIAGLPISYAAASPQPAGSGPLPVVSGNKNRPMLIALVSATPFIALILFFITGSWLFFLGIPLVGAIVGPMIGQNDDRSDRDERRNRRRG